MSKWLGVAILSLVVLLLPGVVSAAAPSTPADDIVKAVFVHYPRQPELPSQAKDAKNNNARNKPGSSSTCPDPSTCTDYKWGGQRWYAAPDVEVNPTGSDMSGADVMAAVSNAFGAWSQKTTNPTVDVHVTEGTTSCATAGTTRNGNQICFRDLTSSYPNAIAVTFVWYSRATKQIVEADTVFNIGSGFAWSNLSVEADSCPTYDSCNTNAGGTTYDLRDIATHEFGHFLAFFGDLYNSQDAQLTMFGYGSTGETSKISLGMGDCLGIVKAYGGSC